jgi:hypothetical protein
VIDRLLLMMRLMFDCRGICYVLAACFFMIATSLRSTNDN